MLVFIIYHIALRLFSPKTRMAEDELDVLWDVPRKNVEGNCLSSKADK